MVVRRDDLKVDTDKLQVCLRISDASVSKAPKRTCECCQGAPNLPLEALRVEGWPSISSTCRVCKDKQSILARIHRQTLRNIIWGVGGERELVEDALYRSRHGEEMTLSCASLRGADRTSIAAFGGHGYSAVLSEEAGYTKDQFSRA